MVFERAEILAAELRGREELLVAARPRQKLAQDREELPAVAMPDEEQTLTRTDRSAAVERERARETNRALNSRRMVVFARPGEVGGGDPGGASERLDVVAREVRQIAEHARDVGAREAANRAPDVGQGRERTIAARRKLSPQ